MTRRHFSHMVARVARKDGLNRAQRAEAVLHALELWDKASPGEREDFEYVVMFNRPRPRKPKGGA